MAADAFIKFGADATAFFSSIKQMQKQTAEACTGMVARLARLGQAFQAVSSIGGAIKSVGGGIADAAKAVIGPAAEAETLALSFEVMLRSETKALEFMERLNQYAAETPFALDEISKAAKLMLSNTSMNADEVMETLQRIGNLSAMTGKSMADIAQVYAKAMNVGVTNEVAESLETMGIPLRKTIAELRGISFEDVFGMISRRELSAVHLNAALESLTTKGGKFDGATARLSQTFSGLALTLEDNVNAALRKFGEELLPQIKPVMHKFIELIEKATPSFQRLGYMVGKWLGERVSDKVLPALNKFILRIPELRVHLEYLINRVLETVDSIMLIPNAIAGVHNAMKNFSQQLYGYFAYDFDWEQAGKWADRVNRSNSAAGKRDAELKRRREAVKQETEWAAERLRINKEAAKARDAERAAQREATAEAKCADDARLRGIMLEDEANKRAAQNASRLLEENQKQWESYQKRRLTWQQKQEDLAYSKRSIDQQEGELRAQGAQLGVGELSPEAIRARMDTLATPGDTQEMAALGEIMKQWEAINEKQKEYTEQFGRRKDNLIEWARQLGVEGEVSFDAIERKQAELGKAGAAKYSKETAWLGDLKAHWLLLQRQQTAAADKIAKEKERLQAEAAAKGVPGADSPEAIRRRLAELGSQGAESNKEEIAQLERLLEKWAELTARKEAYAKVKRENELNLRAKELEAMGHKHQARQLREQLETEKRIEELKNQGYSDRAAEEQAAAEAKARQDAELQQKINNRRIEFVQSHQAAEGGGGVSYRIGGSQLEEAKRTNNYLKRMEQEVKNVARNMTASTTAVLA